MKLLLSLTLFSTFSLSAFAASSVAEGQLFKGKLYSRNEYKEYISLNETCDVKILKVTQYYSSYLDSDVYSYEISSSLTSNKKNITLDRYLSPSGASSVVYKSFGEKQQAGVNIQDGKLIEFHISSQPLLQKAWLWNTISCQDLEEVK